MNRQIIFFFQIKLSFTFDLILILFAFILKFDVCQLEWMIEQAREKASMTRIIFYLWSFSARLRTLSVRPHLLTTCQGFSFVILNLFFERNIFRCELLPKLLWCGSPGFGLIMLSCSLGIILSLLCIHVPWRSTAWDNTVEIRTGVLQ